MDIISLVILSLHAPASGRRSSRQAGEARPKEKAAADHSNRAHVYLGVIVLLEFYSYWEPSYS